MSTWDNLLNDTSTKINKPFQTIHANAINMTYMAPELQFKQTWYDWFFDTEFDWPRYLLLIIVCIINQLLIAWICIRRYRKIEYRAVFLNNNHQKEEC